VVEAQIRQRHREFVFHVGERAQAAQHDIGAKLANKMNGQAVECFHFHVVEASHHLLKECDAIFGGKERRFFRVDADAHHQPVEEPAATPNYVEVAQMDRIEHARVHSYPASEHFGHEHCPFCHVADWLACSNNSTACLPVMPGRIPSACACGVASTILAGSKSSGSTSGLAGVPRQIAMAWPNSAAVFTS